MSIIEESKSDFWRNHSNSRGSATKLDALTFRKSLRSRAADDVRPPPFLAQYVPMRECLPHERDSVWHCEQNARLRDFQLTLRASATLRLQRWWRRVSVDPLRPTQVRTKLMLRRQEAALLAAARQPRRSNASDLAAGLGARSMRERLQAELDVELRAETEACAARRRTEAERTAAHLVLGVANAEARDAFRHVKELRETAAARK